MAQDTDTVSPKEPDSHTGRILSREYLLHELRRPRKSFFSPLLLRLFAINSISLLTILAGLLYISQYQEQQIALAQTALQNETRLLANAVAENTVSSGYFEAERILNRLVNSSGTRARIFDKEGIVIADTAWGKIDLTSWMNTSNKTKTDKIDIFIDFIGQAVKSFPMRRELPRFEETGINRSSAYPDAEKALQGNATNSLWQDRNNNLVFMASAPILKNGEIIGAVLLSRAGTVIDGLVREQRTNAFIIVALGFLTTFIISIYLGIAIGRPIRRLARAASDIQTTSGRQVDIPDLSKRNDEIGDLSIAFRAMMQNIWQRMDALDQFAADVSHELKNPLTSLRSAVETLLIVQKPEQQRRLYTIIQNDVQRLDRLISDIALLSRLDSQLSRAMPEDINLSDLLSEIAQSYNLTLSRLEEMGDTKVIFLNKEKESLRVSCVVSRLEQVLRNLIDNALSFVPPGGNVYVSAQKQGFYAEISVEDEGPGIPEDKLEKIFNRFYTDREIGGEKRITKFAGHSGLGLSIVQKIVESAGGSIHAENRTDKKGKIIGARFVFTLPLMS